MCEFVRQQIIELENTLNSIVYLIHDNARQFNLNYFDYGIKEIKTSVNTPNMNSICERFVGSAQREALDSFLLFNEKQVRNILKNYITYYYNFRPHQGIAQRIANGYSVQENGIIRSKPILGGLHHHYFRAVA